MNHISYRETCEGVSQQSSSTIPLSNNLLVEDDEHDVNEGKEERHPENGQ